MRNSDKLACRVCGLIQPEPPWGWDGRSPKFNICNCCGAEFGYEDATVKAAKGHRQRWLDRGKVWFDPKQKPENWDFDEQFKNIPLAYR